MLISTLYLEKAALKSYYDSGEHLKSYDEDEGGRISEELGSVSSRVEDSFYDDVMYHGGHSQKGGKKS